jgi:hypothetical protein
MAQCHLRLLISINKLAKLNMTKYSSKENECPTLRSENSVFQTGSRPKINIIGTKKKRIN